MILEMESNLFCCLECEKTFSEPFVSKDKLEHFGSPCSLNTNLCPYCYSGEIAPAHKCDVCNKPIDGTYIETINGDILCDDCYTVYHK